MKLYFMFPHQIFLHWSIWRKGSAVGCSCYTAGSKLSVRNCPGGRLKSDKSTAQCLLRFGVHEWGCKREAQVPFLHKHFVFANSFFWKYYTLMFLHKFPTATGIWLKLFSWQSCIDRPFSNIYIFPTLKMEALIICE